MTVILLTNCPPPSTTTTVTVLGPEGFAAGKTFFGDMYSMFRAAQGDTVKAITFCSGNFRWGRHNDNNRWLLFQTESSLLIGPQLFSDFYQGESIFFKLNMLAFALSPIFYRSISCADRISLFVLIFQLKPYMCEKMSRSLKLEIFLANFWKNLAPIIQWLFVPPRFHLG